MQSGRGVDLQRELGIGDLGLRRELGVGALDIDRMRTQLQNEQFYADLGLRDKLGQAETDRFLAQLGFNAADRARYWDSVTRSGYKWGG